jgi:predicted HicB family RNase H-like nuclease
MPQAQTEQVKFVLRLPPSLHKKIKRRAKSNNTSMNKEITNILSDAMSGSSVEKTLEDLVARLEKKKVI